MAAIVRNVKERKPWHFVAWLVSHLCTALNHPAEGTKSYITAQSCAGPLWQSDGLIRWLPGGTAMDEQLKLDGSGNVITQPVMGWRLTLLGGIALLLSVDYATNPEELETGEGQRVQFALTAEQAQQLGEALKTAAEKVYQLPPGDAKFQ
jgi:hypothetical protein